MSNSLTTQIYRSLDWVLCKTAAVTFDTIQYFNKRNPNPSVTPQWSDKPLLKSWEKSNASKKPAKPLLPEQKTGATSCTRRSAK